MIDDRANNGVASKRNDDMTGEKAYSKAAGSSTLSLEDALQLDSYAEYRAQISAIVGRQDSKILRLAMLQIINNHSNNIGIMNRLLHTESLPWALIHGKLLCKLYMNGGIYTNEPFLIQHLVFPEVYMHKLMSDAICFCPVRRVKRLTEREIRRLMSNPPCSEGELIFLVTRRLDMMVSRVGLSGVLEILGRAIISAIGYHAKFVEKKDGYPSYAKEVISLFVTLEPFPSHEMPWTITENILSKVSILKTLGFHKWQQTVVSLLPRPLSSEMLTYILENVDRDMATWIGRLYPEWDSTLLAQVLRAQKGGADIMDGVRKNQFAKHKGLLTKDGELTLGKNDRRPLKYVNLTPESIQKIESACGRTLTPENIKSIEKSLSLDSTASVIDAMPSTGGTLRVIQNFRCSKDEPSLQVYSDLSDQDVPLVMSQNPEIIFSRLNELFPWAKRANEIVCRQLSISRMGRGYVYINPLLLLGPPGVGKTRYSQELAKLLGIPMVYYGAAGSADTMLLKGSARGWRGARPSLAIETIRRHGVANPLILIDEIDKAGSGNYNGRVEDYLHGVLEPGSARNVLDECLMIPVDLSAITWVLTANRKDDLSSSLLSRLTVINIPAPARKYCEVVVRGVIRSSMEEHHIHESQLPDISDSLWVTFTRSADRPRTLRKMVEAWIGEVGRGMTIQ